MSPWLAWIVGGSWWRRRRRKRYRELRREDAFVHFGVAVEQLKVARGCERYIRRALREAEVQLRKALEASAEADGAEISRGA